MNDSNDGKFCSFNLNYAWTNILSLWYFHILYHILIWFHILHMLNNFYQGSNYKPFQDSLFFFGLSNGSKAFILMDSWTFLLQYLSFHLFVFSLQSPQLSVFGFSLQSFVFSVSPFFMTKPIPNLLKSFSMFPHFWALEWLDVQCLYFHVCVFFV